MLHALVTTRRLMFSLCISSIVVACSQARFVADARSGARKSSGPTPPTEIGIADNPTGPGPNTDAPNETPTGKTNPPVNVAKGNPDPNNPAPKPVPGSDPQPTRRLVQVNCSSGRDSSVATVDFKAPQSQKVEMQIQGEFCPQSTNKLSVLFVVDYSASMGKHLFPTSNAVEAGSDPLVNGSCGRFAAMKSIIERLKTVSKVNDEVQVAFIPFASRSLAQTPYSISFTNVSEFSSVSTADKVCRYISQGSEYDSPGSISMSQTGSEPGTNYAAAFNAAQQFLNRRSGQKIMYFISDGEPTVPADDPTNASIAAGEQLRRNTPNLTVNALLLKSRNQGAIDLLNKIAGSAERVKLASDASQLASLIAEFKPAAIDERFGSARIFTDPYPEQALGLVSMRKTSDKVWTYLTQPFTLLGLPGRVVDNRVSVYAKGVDGSLHSSIVTVKYLRE